MDELGKIEKESRLLTEEIRSKQKENVQLRKDVENLQAQISKNESALAEIQMVCSISLESPFLPTLAQNLPQLVKSFHKLYTNRRMDSQNKRMSTSKMISQSKKNEQEISELRCTLRSLKMRTFPSFPSHEKE